MTSREEMTFSTKGWTIITISRLPSVVKKYRSRDSFGNINKVNEYDKYQFISFFYDNNLIFMFQVSKPCSQERVFIGQLIILTATWAL